MSDAFVVRQDGPVARVTINRPEKGNMLTVPMAVEAGQTIARLGADPAVKAVVLAGNGPDFCRGRDLTDAPEHGPTSALDMRGALMDPILGAYAAIRATPVPVIAAVRGSANGFGTALAGVCDVTIATENARFALPELKNDLPPTLAMCAVFDRVPSKALAWLVYATEAVDARTALSLGIVSRVVPDDGLDAAVEAFVSGIATRSRAALVTVKKYLAGVRTLDTATASDLAGNMLAVVLSSKR